MTRSQGQDFIRCLTAATALLSLCFITMCGGPGPCRTHSRSCRTFQRHKATVCLSRARLMLYPRKPWSAGDTRSSSQSQSGWIRARLGLGGCLDRPQHKQGRLQDAGHCEITQEYKDWVKAMQQTLLVFYIWRSGYRCWYYSPLSNKMVSLLKPMFCLTKLCCLLQSPIFSKLCLLLVVLLGVSRSVH
jgi:hypothetical protein